MYRSEFIMKSRNYFIRFFLFLPVIFLSACSSINSIGTFKDAQDHFNQASHQEIAAKNLSINALNPTSPPPISTLSLYRLSYSSADDLIKKSDKHLKQNKLLGAAYMLKALSLWRISNLDGDPKQVTELRDLLDEIKAKNTSGELTLGTRDQVLNEALYGLIDNNLAQQQDNYNNARKDYISANNRLNSSLTRDVPKSHPVRTYVRLSQLRVFRSWNRSLTKQLPNCQQSDICLKNVKKDRATIKNNITSIYCEFKPLWEGRDENSKPYKTLKNQLIREIGQYGLDTREINQQCKK